VTDAGTLGAASAADAAALEARATRDNALARVFEHARRHGTRQAALPIALLSTNGMGYLLKRTTVLFARVPVRTALHVAEIIVLSAVVELDLLGRLLAIRSIVAAAGAFHWGALEPLRQSVRRALGRGDGPAAAAETARYLRLSIDFCVLQLALLVAVLELGPRPYSAFSIFDAYAIGCGVRLMLDTVTRTYHAGVFAVRRVRRPFAALFAVDLADAGGPLLLFPWLGFWGFAVAQLLGGLVEAALTFVYARRAYRELALVPPTRARVLSERSRSTWQLVRGTLLPGFVNLVSQVDALLITALALGPSHGAYGLAAGLHALRPVLGLGSGWARIFYFDLARLDGPVRRLFRLRFERLLVRAAPLFALAAIVVATALGILLQGAVDVPLMLAVTPFVVVRSFFAVTQIQAFVRGAYGVLALGALLVVAAVVTLGRVHASGTVLLLLATGALAGAALVFRLGRSRVPAPERDDSEGVLRPLPFLARVAAAPEELRVLVLGLWDAAGARPSGVATALLDVPGVAFAARFSRHAVLVAASEGRTLLPALVAASGGALASVTAPQTRRALGAELERASGRSGNGSALGNATALRARFTRDFPRGTILDAERGAIPKALASPRELVWTLRELGGVAAGSQPARRRGLRTAVYAPGGEAELVFIAPPDADPERFAMFERDTFWSSVRATLTPA
jgi:hypothetical protein